MKRALSWRPWPRGDRGFVLWLFGLAVALSGLFNFVVSTPPAYVLRMLVLPFGVLHLPPLLWGLAFVATGVFAMVVAYTRELDRLGFTALTTLCGCASLCYLAGVPLGGQLRGFGGAVIYGLFSVLLYRLAGYDDSLDADSMVPSS